MHKYIKKAVRQQSKSIKESTQSQISSERLLSDIRKHFETGKKFTEQKIKDLLINRNSQEKQQITYELLMYGEIKTIQKIIKSNVVSKQEIIDSSKQLKSLYETLLKESQEQKKVNKNQKESQITHQNNEIRTQQMSTKQLFLNSLKKKFNNFKKMNSTHIGIVLTVIFVLLLLKKFKGRIVPFLRSLLNV